ncbi:MAG: serine protease [bacterium]
MKNNLYALILIILFIGRIEAVDINSEEKKTFPAITMINHVEFYDTIANNPIAGCSFLLKSDKGVFAITCKHALWVAKSKEMNGIHFEGTLKEWRMQRKDDSTKYVITDKLLNEDRNELIGEKNVNSDYLVFSIKENNCDVKPVMLRETELIQGEQLYLLGWSFADKTGPQRIYKAKYFKRIENHILIEHEDNSNLAGMSGGPVVDEAGNLVGIVSNYYFDEETKTWYGSPCSTEYLRKILERQ